MTKQGCSQRGSAPKTPRLNLQFWWPEVVWCDLTKLCLEQHVVSSLESAL